MPAANVQQPWPLTRFNTLFPGQYGVPGAWNKTGLRQSCEGAIFYVDPNHADPHDQRDGTNPNAPLATIGEALTQCTAYQGDMIVVMANDAWALGSNVTRATAIQESVTITTPGVKLVGMSPSGALGVTWQPTTGGTPAIYVRAIDVLIEGFAFDGIFDPAIQTAWDGTDTFGDNLTVRNCWFGVVVPEIGVTQLQTGIEFRWMYHADIHHNRFMMPEEHGVFANPTFGAPRYCHIHHNYFINAGITAIAMENAQWCKIYENQVINDDAIQGAAATDEGIVTTGTGIGNAVHHNTLSCLLPAAAPGDYDDFCSPANPGGVPADFDAWISNFCMNGPSVTNPT